MTLREARQMAVDDSRREYFGLFWAILRKPESKRGPIDTAYAKTFKAFILKETV